MLPGDVADLEEEINHYPKRTYIAKPAIGSEGNGIVLFKKMKDFPKYSTNSDWIVQRYIQKPLTF